MKIVKLTSLLQFPALDIPGSEKWKELDKETREFDQLIENHSEIQVVNCTPGKVFRENLEFEVLATHEDIYPVSLGYFNDSTILLMTVDGCKPCYLVTATIQNAPF